MKRVLISVEGQTEETFVKQLLAPHLAARAIFLIPTIVTTKRRRGGPDFKGGLASYAQTKADLIQLFQDSNATAITTLYDVYGLPSDFPGWKNRPAQAMQKVAHLETALQADIDRLTQQRRFRAYLQLHEFEAFLFVDPDLTADGLLLEQSQRDQLFAIQQSFENPELINDEPETAPSKRLQKFIPRYKKRLDGPLIVLEMGLEKIRRACPHFNEWLSWLENL